VFKLQSSIIFLGKKKFDPASGCFYYENQQTGESAWDPPPTWKEPPSDLGTSTSVQNSIDRYKEYVEDQR